MTGAEYRDKHFAMRERAAKEIAVRISTLLSNQWTPLKDAGWNDDDIKAILNDAVEECSDAH
jgi:hypothetical protein